MKIVGACEYALVIYKDKLPKFNNNGKMILNWFLYTKDDKSIPKIHPTQKPVNLLKRLIEIFTDKGDVVLDPCCGSGSTGKAVMFENRERNKNYKFIGIELEKEYLPIIVARIKYAKYKLNYDEERKQKENGFIQEKLFEW